MDDLINATDANASAPALALQWSVWGVFNVVSSVITLLLNAGVLLLLLRPAILIQPFTLYLLNLLVSNLLWILVEHPLDLLSTSYARWWLGDAVCTLFLYASYVLSNGVISAQVLITVNRLWAVTFPVHYRDHHTRRVAVLLIAGMWAFSHVCLLSGVLLDALRYRRPPARFGCVVNTGAGALEVWGNVTQWLNFNLELLFSACAYFFIWYKRRQLLLARLQRVSPLPGAVHRESDTCRGTLPLSPPSRPRARSQSFMILTLLTWSMFLNQIPASIYFTAVFYVDPARSGMQTLFRISTVCLSLQSGLNPILFAVVMDTVRESFRHWLHGVRRCWAAARGGCRREAAAGSGCSVKCLCSSCTRSWRGSSFDMAATNKATPSSDTSK
ncbi:5-hydroxytryptamine receptor 1B-like [Paramacrobiotus metropolitanus]|uniref:5-hydroxytryptamine receptor 1B-like n=1 Tax=Paramacrobiotus metropolitanus TaxID=2943436 RepID=UPI002445F992|nr:5-hydroxytryptamine receptor 1B-like [Paramacrobiotus metropolitanus]